MNATLVCEDRYVWRGGPLLFAIFTSGLPNSSSSCIAQEWMHKRSFDGSVLFSVGFGRLDPLARCNEPNRQGPKLSSFGNLYDTINARHKRLLSAVQMRTVKRSKRDTATMVPRAGCWFGRTRLAQFKSPRFQTFPKVPQKLPCPLDEKPIDQFPSTRITWKNRVRI